MRVLSLSLLGLVCVGTMASTTTANSQPSARSLGQISGGGIQLIDNRDRRSDYTRRHHRGSYGRYYRPYYVPYAYYGPYPGPYYYPYYAPYHGPSVSFSFGF
jgi:hypothetical protein